MFTLRLRTRLILSYLLVLVLGLGALTFWVGVRLQRATIEAAEHELETEAFLVGLSVGEDIHDLDEGEGRQGTALGRLRLISDQVASRQRTVGIYDPAGRPVLATYSSPPQLPSEVASALSGIEAHAIREQSDTGESYLYVAVPVFHDERIVGAIQLGQPFGLLQAEIYRTWTLLVLSSGAIVLLGIAVAIWLARGIAAPIQLLTETAEAIAAGNLDRRTHLETNDEIGRLGQVFDRTADQLTLLLDQQRRFVADASHELRTPLTAIGLRAEALLGGARHDNSVAERYLREIETETERMKGIIEDLLALSRFEAGLDQPQDSTTTLDEVLKRAVASITPLAERAQTAIVTEIATPGLLVQLDERQFQRALVNLLSNAVKQSPPGSAVTLTARVDGDVPKEGGAIRISVRDMGPGIPSEHVPHLFKRFYRVDQSRDRATGGTGLGLAIVKAIVEAHGARIWVESSPDQGATFHILLPHSRLIRLNSTR